MTKDKMAALLRQGEDDDAPEPGKTLEDIIGHLSPSKIDMYARCPMQVEWRYVKGVVAPPGIAMVEGSKYHETAAYRNERVMKGKKVVVNEMLDHFADRVTDMLNKDGRGDIEWGDENEDTLLARSKKLIPKLYMDLAPVGKPLEVEGKFKTYVGPDRIPMVGITDLRDEGGVADYKVVSQRKSQSVADSSVQLTIYALYHKVKKVRLDQLVKTKEGDSLRLWSSRGPGDFKWLQMIATRTWNSIMSGSFPPCDPSSWVCSSKWCGWYAQCRGACYPVNKK
jgi:hypothetical protein